MTNNRCTELTGVLDGSASNKVYVIAEIGTNHGGDLSLALKYIGACAAAGADAVKFQSWTTTLIQNPIDPTSNESHPAFPVLKKYEIPHDWYSVLTARCNDLGIDFLSTPFDVSNARLLKQLKVPAIKIASGDLTYKQLLNEVGCYQLPILLSTGMASLVEVEQALSDLGDEARQFIILLHCVGAYPPAFKDANLRAIQTLKNTFGLPVGISDHYPGYTTVLAAIGLGARVVEKHVTFSRQDETPDSPFALEMEEFIKMVKQIRLLESAMGDGVKQCQASEQGGISGGRRSLYWCQNLSTGSSANEKNIGVLRPNEGDYQPRDLTTLIGQKITRNVVSGSPVRKQDFNAN